MTEERVQRARFGLLLLMLAERIRELEAPAAPSTPGAPAGFVPEFLPEEPMDPFSGRPYLRDPVSGRWYSVGPDGKDQGLKVLYDRDDGVRSAGDVAVP